MFPLRLARLVRSFFQPVDHAQHRQSRQRDRRRRLAYESLETRQMLAVAPLQNLSVAQNTGEKPQSKVWEYAGQWWTVMPNAAGTSVFRLDGTSWTPTYQITTNKSVNADVKSFGDLAHVLLFNGTSSQLATLQYDAGPDNRFEAWSLQPQLVNVSLSSGVETATIDVDSTGRMWLASDASSTVEVRYSDGLYTSWSGPITVASGISSDDISAIIAMPNNSIGVMWSNQSTNLFGFRVHQDGAAPSVWSADELPASQSALSVGGGMADDHIHVAVAADGTLYAAVKTSYDKSGYPKIALLVRRPNGAWDNLYKVYGSGTRPVVILNEAAGRLIVAYTSSEGGGDILYRESPLGTISLGPVQVLISGSVNNVTTAKHTSTNQAVFLASSSSTAKGARFSFDTVSPNQAPLVSAGPDTSAVSGLPLALDGTVSDDGLPTPATLTTTWTIVSGPGTVTFGNSTLVDTTANFSAAGDYVLRLTVSDGQLSAFDELNVAVAAASGDPPVPPPTGDPTEIAFQDGLFPTLAYAGTSDTKLNSGSKTKNYGTAQAIDIDGKPDVAALFRWDVSAIPTGSIVVAAAIEINAITTTKDTYEVYTLQRAWDELAATWQRYAAGQNWTSAGAKGAGDRGTTVLGQLTAANTGIQRIALNEAGVAAVQAWINDSATNYGIILQDYAVSDGVQVSTSEATTAALRPKLIVNYEPAGTVAALSLSGPMNVPPTVHAGPDPAVPINQLIQLTGVVSDDGLPGGLALLTVLWTKVSGPGTVTFGDAASTSTTAQFSLAGNYLLRLTVNDGQLSAFDELNVTVS